jgi:hypothetical protein
MEATSNRILVLELAVSLGDAMLETAVMHEDEHGVPKSERDATL